MLVSGVDLGLVFQKQQDGFIGSVSHRPMKGGKPQQARCVDINSLLDFMGYGVFTGTFEPKGAVT